MAQYSSILVLQRTIIKDIMRAQILQASLSHMQAIGLGLNTRDRKLQLLNIHIFI